MGIYPVIMCGGSGTRLWPVSRPTTPKQFVPLVGDKTLFQQTVSRVRAIKGFKRLIVIAGADHGTAIASQTDSDLDPVILLEPEGRDSAPAIAAATSWIADHDPEGIAVIVASDHFIPDTEQFCDAIANAAEGARQGRIVTMGIHPTHPTSAYGYIRPGAQHDKSPIRHIRAFVEKPDMATAQHYINDGYLWNSGNFIFSATSMIKELNAHAPDVLSAARTGLNTANRSGIGCQLGEAFRQAPKISIDYAVMEKTQIASVLPVALTWSDLGAWDAVANASNRDENDNVIIGDVLTDETRNCYIRSTDSMLVASVGVNNLAIIAENDAVLVCDLANSQSVKTIVNKLKQDQKPHLDHSETGTFSSLQSMAAWYQQWLFTAALPLWWSIGGDHQGWGFHDYLTQEGTPQQTERRVRVQIRQTYSYALAGQLRWSGPWRQAVQHGLEGLQKYCKRDDGLYRTRVGFDGSVVDDTVLLYNQAFAILLLSACKSIVDDAEDQALTLVSSIENIMRHETEGFVENSLHPYASNPHMHLFEAALAWRAISDNPRWAQLANNIADLAITRFIDPEQGFLREFFEPDWSPKTGPEGHIVEPGHQFEWAWLISRWAKHPSVETIIPQEKANIITSNLFDGGLRSIDYARNVAVNQLGEGLHPLTMQARTWPQTERVKAALAMINVGDPAECETYEGEALSAGASLRRYLNTDIRGLWYDTMESDGAFRSEDVTASTLYHLITMIEQLLLSTG